MSLYFQYKSQFILSIFVPVKVTGINKTHSLPESCRNVGPSDADWPTSVWWLEMGSWPIKWLLANELPGVPRGARIIRVSFRNVVWKTKITLGGEAEKTWIKKPWRTGGAQSLWDVESESEVAQLCPTLCDPMDCSLPGYTLKEWNLM